MKDADKDYYAYQKNDKYQYNVGFGNHFASEAVEGALPKNQNTPQRGNMGLYTEQLSGTAFTEPRASNQRSWLYRIQPSVVHVPFKRVKNDYLVRDFSKYLDTADPNQTRWKPFQLPSDDTKVNFVDGLRAVAGAGSPQMKEGVAIYVYLCNASMISTAFNNSDGDFLIVPQQGALDITTEFGKMYVSPGEICVIQRGIRFSVAVDGASRGYICEVYDDHFVLPDLGPIGANGLANPRDFLSPRAAFEDTTGDYTILNKYLGGLYSTTQKFSPFNVVAWHGNYVPYKYDLALFNTINSVSYDHIDPSIFTVLTCQTTKKGVACCDFVIFPPRYIVQERTFRPPYFHRNCMSEFMGLIRGIYEAKLEGFLPGGASLHSCMTPHGPDSTTYKKHSTIELKPEKLPDSSLAFMFESSYLFTTTEFADKSPKDDNYYKCWEDLDNDFKNES
eukprot:TRINITY_DN8225_c0_g1_i1.p1 TRINITY_DN8225_c0_g1~~TRINITY_DN8225_c0_g1_i1.p1  ORF type:complete len:447 (-),score=64.43 TRINITY_DN8225_c0_g1_i1:128-1468(-)